MATPLPWVYPYQEDGPRLGSIVHRPTVPVSLVGDDISTPVLALVDSGCSHTLAAPWLAMDVGADPKASGREINLGIGGTTVKVRFVDLTLRLYAPGDDDSDYVEWQDEVGFLQEWRATWPILVGQVAFMQNFTVTMSRHAQCLAIEGVDAFDARFGVPLARG